MSDEVKIRCGQIIADFDRWLALQVLNGRLRYDDLPSLNDMFRDYFANMRSAKPSEPDPVPEASGDQCLSCASFEPCACVVSYDYDVNEILRVEEGTR